MVARICINPPTYFRPNVEEDDFEDPKDNNADTILASKDFKIERLLRQTR